MPKIRVTTEVLQQKANELEQCMEDQRQIIHDVATLIHEVVEDWQGEAQRGFIEAAAQKRPVYERFGVDLSRFAHHLRDYASRIEYIDLLGGHDIRNRVNGGGRPGDLRDSQPGRPGGRP